MENLRYHALSYDGLSGTTPYKNPKTWVLKKNNNWWTIFIPTSVTAFLALNFSYIARPYIHIMSQCCPSAYFWKRIYIFVLDANALANLFMPYLGAMDPEITRNHPNLIVLKHSVGAHVRMRGSALK